MSIRKKRKRYPARIPDTPENVLKAVLESPVEPEGGWQYRQKEDQEEKEDGQQPH